jgi:hypothetical protein
MKHDSTEMEPSSRLKRGAIVVFAISLLAFSTLLGALGWVALVDAGTPDSTYVATTNGVVEYSEALHSKTIYTHELNSEYRQVASRVIESRVVVTNPPESEFERRALTLIQSNEEAEYIWHDNTMYSLEIERTSAYEQNHKESILVGGFLGFAIGLTVLYALNESYTRIRSSLQ